MYSPIDHTHEPLARSWIDSANVEETDFPIQNLPLAAVRWPDGSQVVGVAIGDQVLSLAVWKTPELKVVLPPAVRAAAVASDMAALFTLDSADRQRLRHATFELLEANASQRVRQILSTFIQPIDAVTFHLPARIPNYTDFYAGIYHAIAVGSMFRPESPLLPNYKHLPVAYHGRASTITVDHEPVRRPWGQVTDSPAGPPRFQLTQRLDFEVELGIWIACGSNHGVPVPLSRAPELIFGCSLLNDWSARDLQAWEYQPLGPFLSKSFHTTISPWVVTHEALAPFRVPAFTRDANDPALLAHLHVHEPDDRAQGGLALRFEMSLKTERMRQTGMQGVPLTHSTFRDAYWTIAQMITHHASNGCRLEAGDLLGSGTISGQDPNCAGSLLELTRGGKQPLTLPTGEVRTFLEDGDEILLRGRCEAEGFRSIGFGPCRGRILGG